MIIIDESELREGSTLPPIEGAKSSPCLEKESGADVLISSLGIPASSRRLIEKHVKGGAVLAQLKRGADLLSSIADERINIALARMRSIGTRGSWQRLVISTGCFLPDLGTGEVLVGVPRQSPAGTYLYLHRVDENLPQYKAYATIRWRIAARGGYLLPLTCDDELPATLYQIENDLLYLGGKPVKEIFPPVDGFPPDPPEEDDPLQLPVEVRDGRLVIAAFQGIGPVKATALWKAIELWNEEQGRGKPTLSQALFWASCDDPEDFGIPKVKGWGKGTISSVREQLGMEKGFNFRAMPDAV